MSVSVPNQRAVAGSSFEDEWRLRLADGSYRWVISRAVPSNDDPATARWFGTLTDIDERYRISEERELLAGELAHRIKNLFAVITGLVSMHAREAESVPDYSKALTDNILALSRAQDFALRANATSGEDLKSLLEVLMAPYGAPGSGAVSISGDPVGFGRRAATPLALVFHELATNSAKYGALRVAKGRIAIAVASNSTDATITWSESGGPPASEPEGSGFGSRLMTMAINNQLGGTLTQEWHEEGLKVAMTLPLEQLAQ